MKIERTRRLGNKIAEARKSMLITQEKLDTLLGFPKGDIKKCEDGRKEFPLDRVIELCRILQIDIDDLLDNSMIHIQENELLIDMMKRLLYLTNETDGESFFSKYHLMSREEMIFFPKAAISDFISDLQQFILEHENVVSSFYTEYLFVKGESTTLNEIYKNVFSNVANSNYFLASMQTSSKYSKNYLSLNKIFVSFFGFWGWITQILNLLVNDMTMKGLELIITPITNEEYLKYKSYFPSNPAEFLLDILFERGFKKLDAEGQLSHEIDRDEFLETYCDKEVLTLYLNKYKNENRDSRRISYYLHPEIDC